MVVLEMEKGALSRKLLIIFASAVLILCMPFFSFAIILHPGAEPNLADWPDANAVGRWSSNASCVAVSSNAIITTRHQGGGVGTLIWFEGIEYIVKEVLPEPGPNAADLRLCRVERTQPGATYLKYAPLYTLTGEKSKEFRISGFGKSRGSAVSDANGIGYLWTGNNTIQRWGTNKILKFGWYHDDEPVNAYISDLIVSEFDPCETTPYEAAVASHDSGGGWFIEEGGVWKVAALSAYVQYGGVSYYDPAEKQWGIRISSYADWVSQNIPNRVDGDYSGDYEVDFVDFNILAGNWQRNDCLANNNCDGVDFEPDGDVDWDDLFLLLDNWLN